VIDADVLARAGEVFDVVPLRVPAPGQLALRRVCTRRGAAVIDGNRYLRRLISLARWAFPDVWNGFAGSLATAKAVLSRWPHLARGPGSGMGGWIWGNWPGQSANTWEPVILSV
jgi:hypothetical protein